jgi:hypothetical protein
MAWGVSFVAAQAEYKMPQEFLAYRLLLDREGSTEKEVELVPKAAGSRNL